MMNIGSDAAKRPSWRSVATYRSYTKEDDADADEPQAPPAADKPGGWQPRPTVTIRHTTMTTPETQPAEPKPERRRFQFSLRTLLLLTTVFAGALSLFRWLYVKYGLDIAGLVMLVAIEVGFHAGCALWMVADARKRGKSNILLVAMFAYFGPFAMIPWLLLRPPIKAVTGDCTMTDRTEPPLAICAGWQFSLWELFRIQTGTAGIVAVAVYVHHLRADWPADTAYVSGTKFATITLLSALAGYLASRCFFERFTSLSCRDRVRWHGVLLLVAA